MAPRPETPRADELIAHAAFVRGLARSLLGRETDADDVAQEALAAAIARPPPASVSLRAWLSGTVRNLVRMSRRTDARRGRRERASTPRPGFPAPEETASRLEQERRLVAAVDRLEEPYRSTIVLRYFDGLETREVAARAGLPVETVRTRVKRALARLRADLRSRDAGWRRGLTVVAGLSTTFTIGAAAPAAAAAGGAVIMGKKLAAVAAIVLVAGAFVALHGVMTSPEPPVGPEREVAGLPAPLPDEAPAPSGDEPVAEERPLAPMTADRRPVSSRPDPLLTGLLLGLEGASPDLAEVTAQGLGSAGDQSVRTARGHVRNDGSFLVKLDPILDRRTPIDEVLVRANHPMFLPAETRVPVTRTRDVTLRLMPAGAVTGRVRVRGARAPDGYVVSIHLGEIGEGALAPPIERVTTKDGRFRLRSAANGGHTLVATAPGLRPAVERTTIVVGAEAEAPPLVLEPGESLAGRVRGPRLSWGISVRARRRSRTFAAGGRSVVFVGEALENAEATAPVEKDGRWRIDGLAPGPYVVTVVGRESVVHPDVGEVTETIAHAPDQDVSITLLTSTLTVFVPGASSSRKVTSVTVDGEASADRRADRRGRAVFHVVPERVYRVTAWVAGKRTQGVKEVMSPRAGEDLVVIPEWPTTVRPTGSLEVTLAAKATGDLEPPTRAAFGLFLPTEDSPFAEHDRDAEVGEDGRYVLTDLPPGRWRLVVRAGGTWDGNDGPWLEAETMVRIEAEKTAKASLTMRPGGRLRIGVRSEDGRYLAPRCRVRRKLGDQSFDLVFTHREPGSASSMRNRLVGSGPNHTDPALPPGRYVASLTLDGFRPKEVPFEIEAGRTKTLDVTLTPDNR